HGLLSKQTAKETRTLAAAGNALPGTRPIPDCPNTTLRESVSGAADTRGRFLGRSRHRGESIRRPETWAEAVAQEAPYSLCCAGGGGDRRPGRGGRTGGRARGGRAENPSPFARAPLGPPPPPASHSASILTIAACARPTSAAVFPLLFRALRSAP